MSALPLIIVMLVALYMLMIRPQRRRVQAQRDLVGSLAPGRRVLTAGGMIGTLVAVDGERATVELAPGVVVDFVPHAIVRTLDAPPPGDEPPTDIDLVDDPVPTEPPTATDDLGGLGGSVWGGGVERVVPPAPDADPHPPRPEES